RRFSSFTCVRSDGRKSRTILHLPKRNSSRTQWIQKEGAYALIQPTKPQSLAQGMKLVSFASLLAGKMAIQMAIQELSHGGLDRKCRVPTTRRLRVGVERVMAHTAYVADGLTFETKGEIIISVGWNPSFCPQT